MNIEHNDEFMKDHRGRYCPKSMIPEIDLERDAVVNELIDKALALHEMMKNFKRECFDTISAFVDLSFEEYNQSRGGDKGNVALRSFDGLKKVQLAVADLESCDERILIAKDLIVECLMQWTKDSPDEIKSIVNDVFEVDKSGHVSTKKVLDFRRKHNKSDNPKWMKAMNIISDSIMVYGSKSYVRFFIRDGIDDKLKAVSLNFAKL